MEQPAAGMQVCGRAGRHPYVAYCSCCIVLVHWCQPLLQSDKGGALPALSLPPIVAAPASSRTCREAGVEVLHTVPH